MYLYNSYTYFRLYFIIFHIWKRCKIDLHLRSLYYACIIGFRISRPHTRNDHQLSQFHRFRPHFSRQARYQSPASMVLSPPAGKPRLWVRNSFENVILKTNETALGSRDLWEIRGQNIGPYPFSIISGSFPTRPQEGSLLGTISTNNGETPLFQLPIGPCPLLHNPRGPSHPGKKNGTLQVTNISRLG